MSNAQLYLAMAIPTLTVLVGIVVNNGRLNSIEAQLRDLRSEVMSMTGKMVDIVDRLARLEERSH